MNLYRVIMSVHTERDGWSSSIQLPTFYVHGASLAEAGKIANVLALAGSNPSDNPQTSGSLVRVDDNLDPMGDVFSWSFT